MKITIEYKVNKCTQCPYFFSGYYRDMGTTIPYVECKKGSFDFHGLGVETSDYELNQKVYKKCKLKGGFENG